MSFKVSWIFIPITVIFVIIYFIVATIIIIKYLTNNFNKQLQNDMKNICKKYDVNKQSIQPFENLSIFHKHNSDIFVLLNLAISSWSGCQIDIPTLTNFDLVKTFKGYDVTGKVFRDIAALYYSKSLNISIITFAGTMYLTEWIDDFDFTQVGVGAKPPTTPLLTEFNINDNMKVTMNANTNKIKRGVIGGGAPMVQKHHYNMYQSFRNQFVDSLNSIKNVDTILVVTGHSMGASLSTICYFDVITNNLVKNRTLYNYGSPRVGNVDFANIINVETTVFRIANSEDIITTLPPPIGKYTYEHINNCISFSLNLGSYGKNHVDAYTDLILL